MALPRVSVGSDGIYAADIASALANIQFSNVVITDIKIVPLPAIVAADVDRLGLDIRSFREPLTRCIKQVMIPSIRKNFVSGGRPAWEPLSEGTIIRRGYSAWPILNVTGKLQRRATQLNIWTIGFESAQVESLPSDAYYGMFHQGGARRGNWVLPARPFLVLQEEDIEAMMGVFMTWMTERAILVGRFRGA